MPTRATTAVIVPNSPSSSNQDLESPLLERYSLASSGRVFSSATVTHERERDMGANWSRVEIMANKKKAYYSYAGDWALTILIGIAFYALDRIHGYWRYFSLTDTTIQFPFAEHERVPNWGLYLIALIAPIILLPCINVITIRSWWDWHHSWLGCEAFFLYSGVYWVLIRGLRPFWHFGSFIVLLSFATTGAVTQVVKVTVGRPRPDLISRCQPLPGSENASPFGLATAAICQQKNMAILKDGFRSFPSGHSSLSFAGLGFLSWYLAGKLHLFDRRGHTFKAWIALTPLLGALLVAISRTMDNRHHYQDVTIGSLLGLFLSFFAYRQYYPPLSSSHSEKPFEPRFLNLRGSMSVGHHSPRTDGQEELDLNRTRNTAGRSDGERYADDEGEEDVGASRV